MTVQQLMDRLRDFPPDMEVKALWDCVPGFTVHRVERFTSRYDHLTIALIDCGDDGGDWESIADENETHEAAS